MVESDIFYQRYNRNGRNTGLYRDFCLREKTKHLPDQYVTPGPRY